jgi:hypothetical protein
MGERRREVVRIRVGCETRQSLYCMVCCPVSSRGWFWVRAR